MVVETCHIKKMNKLKNKCLANPINMARAKAKSKGKKGKLAKQSKGKKKASKTKARKSAPKKKKAAAKKRTAAKPRVSRAEPTPPATVPDTTPEVTTFASEPQETMMEPSSEPTGAGYDNNGFSSMRDDGNMSSM
jgi:hypothetical protein